MSALLCAGAAIGFATGCPIINTQHCGYHENGAENPCPADYVCSVCAVENNGCVPIGQMDTIKQSCLEIASTSTVSSSTSPTETTMTSLNPTDTGFTETTATSTITTETTTMAVTESSTDTTMTTVSSTTETTSPPVDCDENNIEDTMCSPQYCLPGGKCGPCTDFPMGTTCAGIDNAKPACNADTGVCMECTTEDTSKCPVDKPACDAEMGKCTPCTEHFECPDSDACDIEIGKCFPKENVVYVFNELNNCISGNGIESDPFCKFTDVPLEPSKPTVIKILPGSSSPGVISIGDGMIVAIVAAGAQIPVIDDVDNQFPKVGITGTGARVYLSHVKYFKSNTSSVLRCSGESLLSLYDVVVAGDGLGTARAIDATGCRLRLRRSLVSLNAAGIQVSGLTGNLRVESSFIVDNKASQYFGGIALVNSAHADVVYSTVIKNTPRDGHSAIQCTGNGNTVTFRNSAVIDIGAGIDGNCVMVDGGLVQPVDNLNSENMLVSDWVKPSNAIYLPISGMKESLLKDTATWGAGDPTLDYLRQPIPQQGMSYGGALQLQP